MPSLSETCSPLNRWGFAMLPRLVSNSWAQAIHRLSFRKVLITDWVSLQLEFSGTISAQYNFCLPDSSDPTTSASQRWGSHFVASLKLLSSSHLLALASQSGGITAMRHHTWPTSSFYYRRKQNVVGQRVQRTLQTALAQAPQNLDCTRIQGLDIPFTMVLGGTKLQSSDLSLPRRRCSMLRNRGRKFFLDLGFEQAVTSWSLSEGLPLLADVPRGQY
ncbi:hypothetical protein AAY473_022331 [Plecturocebus cupreus]